MFRFKYVGKGGGHGGHKDDAGLTIRGRCFEQKPDGDWLCIPEPLGHAHRVCATVRRGKTRVLIPDNDPIAATQLRLAVGIGGRLLYRQLGAGEP